MTAPGDNLEFQASLYFRARASLAPLLLDAVKKLFREDPNAGDVIFSDIKERSFEAQGEQFILIFSRRGNRISLMHVYRHDEREPLAAKKKYLVEQRRMGGKS